MMEAFAMALRIRDVSRVSVLAGVEALLISMLCPPTVRAEAIRNATHLVPTGKGWGEERSNSPFAVVTGNGINYHGGSIMSGTPNVYFIWYGNWSGGPKPSDSTTTVNLLGALFGSS